MNKSGLIRANLYLTWARAFNLCLLYFILIPGTFYGQALNIDSLITLVKTEKDDTIKVKHLSDISLRLMHNDPDTGIVLNENALAISKELNWKKGMAFSLGGLGACYYLKGEFAKALDLYSRALTYDEEENNKEGIARRLGNMGTIYASQANYPKALDCYLRTLKASEEAKDSAIIAMVLGNIGNIYSNLSDYPKALKYYQKALDMDTKLGSEYGIARHLGNIGAIYLQEGDFTKAMEYDLKALKLAEKIGDRQAMGNQLGSLGIAYSLKAASPLTPLSQKKGLQDTALKYYFSALEICKERDDKNGIAIELSGIGSLYFKTGKFREGEEYLKRAIAIQDSIGGLDHLMIDELALSNLYDSIGQYKLALLYYKKAMTLKDTLFSQERNKQLVGKEMSYEFEKKEAATKADQEKKDAVMKIVIYSVSGGFILVLLLAVFIFRGYRQKQKANVIISEQKHLVEEKQKDILDSIHYAKRIQRSLMTNEKHIKKTFDRLINKET